jgi:CYTH domain-containing protein
VPIENEKKYVLRLETPEKKFHDAADLIEDIEQLYLVVSKRRSLRIRKTLAYKNKWCEFRYTLTFKQDVGKKTVEIETKLDQDDYRLLSRSAELKLRKWRYRLGDWEVDFFKSDNQTYFVQAEIEMPVGQKKPNVIHPLVQENLVYAVKRGDGRFSSKKLGDFNYARRIMDHLLLEAV